MVKAPKRLSGSAGSTTAIRAFEVEASKDGAMTAIADLSRTGRRQGDLHLPGTVWYIGRMDALFGDGEMPSGWRFELGSIEASDAAIDAGPGWTLITATVEATGTLLYGSDRITHTAATATSSPLKREEAAAFRLGARQAVVDCFARCARELTGPYPMNARTFRAVPGGFMVGEEPVEPTLLTTQ